MGGCLITLSTPGERLKYARGLLGITRTSLETDHGLSHNTLAAWEIGRVPLTVKGAERLSKVFTNLGLICHADWLLCRTHEFPFFIQNNETNDEVLNANIHVLREIEAFKVINPDPIVMMVSDDGMLPHYEPGDFVAGNKKTGDNIAKLIGTNCIIETNQGDIYFRKLLLGEKKNTFSLLCLNPSTLEKPFIADLKLKSAAQVVWHRMSDSQSPI